MFTVLKSSLTRRLFMIFVGVSLIPTIILMIIPTYLQIKEEERRRQSLLEGLNTKAIQVFSNLAIEKRTQYEEKLKDYVAQTKPIINLIKTSTFSEDEKEILLNQLFATLQEENPVISIVGWCGREYNLELEREKDILFCQQYLPEFEKITNATWFAFRQSNRSLLVYLEPVSFSNGEGDGIFILGVDLHQLVSEVSRFGIAQDSLLLLLDEDGYILGVPEWAKESPVLNYFGCELIDCLNTNLADLAPQPFLDDLLKWKEQSQENSGEQIIQSSLVDYPIYAAFTRIEETPVYVTLFLTSSDLYNQAESYGASLQFNELSIITRGLLSTGGFLVTIIVGAFLTLRQLSTPLHEVVEAAERVEQGDFSTHVREVGLGELQTLAVTYNRMIQAVRNSQGHLNSLLIQRQDEFDLINKIADQTNAEGNISDKLDQVLSMLGNDPQICRAALFLQQGQGITKVDDKIYKLCEDLAGDDEKIFQPQFLSQYFGDITIIQSVKSSCENRINLVIPIQAKNRPIGILVLQQIEPENLDSRTTFLQALTTQIGILIENAELSRQLRDRSILEERNRFARELHDSVTQTVFSLSLVAEGIKSNLLKSSSDPGLIEQVDFLINQARQVRTELRGLIIELRPIELGKEGLQIALLHHAESLRRSTGLEVDTVFTGDTIGLPYSIQYNLNRVAQEALSNVARHARAKKVHLRLDVGASEVMLMIKDDGEGFDMASVTHRSTSQGMITMRERVELLGGEFMIETGIGLGTKIIAKIPLPSLPGGFL